MANTFKVYLDVQRDSTAESWEREYAFPAIPDRGDYVQLWEAADDEKTIVSALVEARVFRVDGSVTFDLAPLDATYNRVAWSGGEFQADQLIPIGGYADIEARLTKSNWERRK